MAEISTCLTALEIDGQAVRCWHAVLITQTEPALEYDWVISLFGVGPERLADHHVVAATANQGERLSGCAGVVAGHNTFHVRLEGLGPLRRLRKAG